MDEKLEVFAVCTPLAGGKPISVPFEVINRAGFKEAADKALVKAGYVAERYVSCVENDDGGILWDPQQGFSALGEELYPE